MKKLIIMCAALMLSIAMCTNVWASYYKTASVVVNDQFIDTYGLIVNNRTLVPMRGVFEKLGYDVIWYPDKKIACFDGADYCIMARTGDNYFLTVEKSSGIIKQYFPDVPHQLIGGHFYVPIRALSEASNVNVLWDGINYTVYVKKESNTLDGYEYFNEAPYQHEPNDHEDNGYPGESPLLNLVDRILDEIIDENADDFDKVLAVHDYLVLNIRYNEEHYYNNTVTLEDGDAYSVLKNHTGVCAGYAAAAQALLNRAGVECLYVTGDAGGNNSWGSHAWNIVNVDGRYYHMDVTWDDPIGVNDEDFISWEYFLVSDSTLCKNHRWSRVYPTCPRDYGYEPPFDYFEKKHNEERYDDDWEDEDGDWEDDDWEDEDDDWEDDDQPESYTTYTINYEGVSYTFDNEEEYMAFKERMKV